FEQCLGSHDRADNPCRGAAKLDASCLDRPPSGNGRPAPFRLTSLRFQHFVIRTAPDSETCPDYISETISEGIETMSDSRRRQPEHTAGWRCRIDSTWRLVRSQLSWGILF